MHLYVPAHVLKLSLLRQEFVVVDQLLSPHFKFFIFILQMILLGNSSTCRFYCAYESDIILYLDTCTYYINICLLDSFA